MSGIKLPDTIKMIITDFDGVVTDNCVYINEDYTMTRKLNFKDVMGFSILKKNGFDIAIISGEGCSGGALGLAVADRVMMLEHAYYTVISPEGCASILWRDASMYAEAAEALKITSKDLLELGIIDEEIPEPLGGAHADYKTTAESMKTSILKALKELNKLSVDELKEQRYNKFRAMGRFIEG